PILAMTTCQTCPHRPHSASMSSPTPGVAIACTLSDVSRIPVLAEHLPEHLADLPERRLGLGRCQHRLHDVVLALAGALAAGQGGAARRGVAPRAQLADALHLLALGLLIDLQRRQAVARRRRRVAVDADDGALAALDLLLERVGRRRDLTLRIALLDRGDDAAHAVDALDDRRRLGLHAVGQRLDEVAAAQR